MFHLFGSLLGIAITAGVSFFGYWQARQFTQNRLRYVDAVHKATAPVLAGLAAAVIALPFVWFLPLVGTGTALLFGGSVALGVNAGSRDIRKRLGAG
jgi:hypothetical protein